MHKLLEHCSLNTYHYTYIGIGSKNRTEDLEKFDADMDQILPCFLTQIKNKMIRAIHFDSRFAENTEFLDKYFKAKGFVKVDNFWRSNNMEVIIYPENMDNDKWFLNEMIKQSAYDRTKLVVQYFTGMDCIPLFKEIYEESSEKDHIKKNVLFDITYGEGHCMTPMTKYFPMLDPNGDFYNFMFYSEAEMINMIGVLPQMDGLIKDYVMKKLSKTLNEDHVNYRKAIRGERFLFNTSDYSMFSTPDEIMGVLLAKISSLLDLLQKLGSLSKEKQDLFAECSENYRDVDVYKWYSAMTKLYK